MLFRVDASMNDGSHPSLPIETELKLSLPAAQVRRLWKSAPLSQLLAAAPSRQRLFSAYYDTPQHDLRRHGVALRLRRHGRRWLQTLKTEGQTAGALQQRIELEVGVPGGVLDYDWLRRSGLREFAKDGIAINTLGIVFTTDFDRHSAIVEPAAGTRIEVCVDRGEIVAGRKRAPICEVELELKQGALAPLFDLAQQLATIPDVRVEPASKALRGYRLAAGERPAPARASNPNLPAKADVDTVFRGLALGCIGQVQANERGVLHSRDIEYLHQARVGLRRLRSVFSLFAGAIAQNVFTAQLAWLREISQMLGEARDWDVFMSEFLPGACSSMEQHPALTRLRKNAARLRANARRRVRAALASPDYTVQMLRLTQLLHDRSWGVERSIEQREIANQSAKAFARSVLDRAYRKAVKHGKRMDRTSLDDFHKLRIRIKKLRYSSELLSPLFGNKGKRKFVSRLQELQNLLGKLNDTANAARLFDQLAPMDADAQYGQVVAYLRGYAHAQSSFCATGFDSAWKKFADETAFW